MRAHDPDFDGFVDDEGVKIGYEVFGTGGPTVLAVPPWTIVHSRVWKMQTAYLADHFRVVTFDRPGNGRSSRPEDPHSYGLEAVSRQALAVLDATDTDRAVLMTLSQGSQETLALAADHPERVCGAVLIGAATTLEPLHPGRADAAATFFDPAADDADGWRRLNAEYWQQRYGDFVDFFFDECLPEPHSTKQHEDCLAWAAETTPEALLVDALDDPHTRDGRGDRGPGASPDSVHPRRRRSHQPADAGRATRGLGRRRARRAGGSRSPAPRP